MTKTGGGGGEGAYFVRVKEKKHFFLFTTRQLGRYFVWQQSVKHNRKKAVEMLRMKCGRTSSSIRPDRQRAWNVKKERISEILYDWQDKTDRRKENIYDLFEK